MHGLCQARCQEDGYASFACQAYCTDYPMDEACPRPGCTTLASMEQNLEYCSQNICDAYFPVFQHTIHRRAYTPINAKIQQGQERQGHLSMMSMSSVWRLLNTATISLAIPIGGGIIRHPIRKNFLHLQNTQGNWAYLVITRLKYSRGGRQRVYVSRNCTMEAHLIFFTSAPPLANFSCGGLVSHHLHFQNDRLPSYWRKLLHRFRLPKHGRPRWGATLRLYHSTQFYHTRFSKLWVHESKARIERGKHAR